MIYELRLYQPVPGQMPKLLARFKDQVLPIWEKHVRTPFGPPWPRLAMPPRWPPNAGSMAW